MKRKRTPDVGASNVLKADITLQGLSAFILPEMEVNCNEKISDCRNFYCFGCLVCS